MELETCWDVEKLWIGGNKPIWRVLKRFDTFEEAKDKAIRSTYITKVRHRVVEVRRRVAYDANAEG